MLQVKIKMYVLIVCIDEFCRQYEIVKVRTRIMIQRLDLYRRTSKTHGNRSQQIMDTYLRTCHIVTILSVV